MMIRPLCTAIALLLAGCLSLAGSVPTWAQNAPGANPDHEQATQELDQKEDEELRVPVLHVTSVEVIRSNHAPVLDIVRVRGVTSSSGWEDAELVPLTRGATADGMLDLILVARAPSNASEVVGFEAIEAIFPLESGHPYKGIRVHSASSAVTLAQLPGYTEGEILKDDCAKCLGKYFIGKGEKMPAGKAESSVAREEQMPPKLRVIKATDGLAKLDADPNRLTLVLGADGRIVSAFWD